LVESYRTAGGSRQRIVAYIGELKDDEQSGWVQLGRRLDKKSRPLPSLFDPPHYDDPTDEEPLEVNLRGVRLERLRDFGDVWLALVLWRFLGLDKLLYDVTSTYFEGECRHNPMAKHGYSRDNRPDCLQVCIGLVVAKDGIPLGHEVFDGNTHDSKTVEQIVRAMESKYGRANRIWVMDRGMVSEDNLRFVHQRGGSIVAGCPTVMIGG